MVDFRGEPRSIDALETSRSRPTRSLISLVVGECPEGLILTPILPSLLRCSRLSTPARFAPALVISRYVCHPPRARFSRSRRVTGRRYPPGRGGASPHAATCPVTKPEPEVFGRRYPPGYAFEPPRYAGATRVFVDIAASRRAGRTRRRVLPAFSTRDLRRHRARRPEPRGLPGHHLTPTPIRLKVHSRAPRLKKKIGEPPTDLHPSPRSTHRS